VKIYTKTGDQGSTGLFGGGRVLKHHPRVAAFGEIDELNSAIGWVRTVEPAASWDEELERIQRDLFAIGGQLATPEPSKVETAMAKAALDQERVAELEHLIDHADAELTPLTAFVLPGGSPKAAALHLARTVCRRAERAVVALTETETVPAGFLVYLNRLSDLLFTWARLANHWDGRSDVTW